MQKFILFFLLISSLALLGNGCFQPADQKTFPPKPPVPGLQRSPVIERLSPQ